MPHELCFLLLLYNIYPLFMIQKFMSEPLRRSLVIFIFLVFSGCLAAQTTIYVDASAAGGNTGTNWTDAYTSFQSALDVAVATDEIWMAKGTYNPSYDYGLGGVSRTYHFKLINGVSIYGGFAGTEALLSQRTNFGEGETNETILSGDLNNDDIFDVSAMGYQGTSGDDNCYHIFYHPSGTNLDNSAIIDGFTITGGNANPSSLSEHSYGGGMFNDGSSPTLSQIIVKNNMADYPGGGMYNNNSSPLILNSTMYSNRSNVSGGAISCWNNCNMSIINSLFYQNYTSGGGGAIEVVNSIPTFTNVTIGNNSAASGGGLYFYFSGSAVVNNCILWGNTANNGKQLYVGSGGVVTMNYSCYSNSTNDIQNAGGTFTATNNNINSDPEFANAASNDLRLYSNSPASNTGLNGYNTQSTDIRGEARIQDGTIDMGAYEWTSGVDPQTIFVNASASGSNNGSSWTDAFTDLQNALSAASSGDQIWVAAGTYKPSVETGGTGSRYKAFQINNGRAVYGGFGGTESAVEERVNFDSGETNETILSGDIGTIGDSTDNCYHVLYNLFTGNNALLDGFTIKEGNASEGWITAMGGGLLNESVTNMTLQNITFESNYACSGGGMASLSSTIILNNVVFKNNCAINGGGITCSGSSHNLNNISFTNNNASEEGGAVYSLGASNITINNSILWGNTCSGDGNEIYIYTGTVNLNYSCYSNSSGDIYNSGGSFNPSNCIASDPLFVNASTGDLRIYGNSPCVNTGQNSYNVLSTDIRGEDRIQNTTIDMGAYEWASGVDPDNRVIYINELASGINNGTNWTDAYTSLQLALGIAVTGDQIWAASGTYKPSSAYDLTNTSRYYHFRMIEGVEIYGGFAGNETSVDQRTSYGVDEVNETILSGDLNGNDNFDVTNGGYQTTTGEDNCYHVFYHPDGMNLSSSAVLDGFTISGGNATDPAGNPHYRAGGFYAFSSSPSIQNVVFKSNSANDIAGAVYIYNSTSDFTNVSFINNKSFSSGGGIYVNDGSPTLNQIYCDQNYSANGGALYINATSLSITNAIFTNNNSTSDGGALSTHSASIDITNALFADNVCSQNGGGLELYSSATEFTSTLNNVIIASNTASGIGGGISFKSSASSDIVLNNSIVYGNTAVANGNEIASNSLGGTTLNYSSYDNSTNDVFVEEGTFVTTNNNITSDPLFVDATGGDYRLFGNSPTVNTGNNSYNPIATDIRGEARIQSTTIDMGAYEWTSGVDPLINILTWTGNTNADWNTSTNWSSDIVPTQACDVVIPDVSNDPVINHDPDNPAICNDLTIQSNAVLSIAAGKALTVSGTLSNETGNSGLILKSTANGTGSLIHSTTGVSGTIERYLPAATWTEWEDGWHFVSSPVANYDINESNFTPASDYDFYAWSEKYNVWVNFKDGENPAFTDADVNGSDDFELGHGYMVAYENTGTKNFVGEINVGNVEISNLSISSGKRTYYSWHLLGNPFSSAITWDATDDWGKTNIAGTTQIWNEAGKSYSAITAGAVIPATNGFMVQANGGTGSLTIPKSKSGHSSQAFYKSSVFPLIKIKAHNLDSPSFQESQIMFNPESTADYEMEYDCDFLAGYAPQFYSLCVDRKLCVNSLPDCQESLKIPFVFAKNEGENFSIEMYEEEGMLLDVWLLDRKSGNRQNLSENPVYVFNAFEGDEAERFEIQFSAVGIEEENAFGSAIQFWASAKTIHILNPDLLEGTVNVFNMLGQNLSGFNLAGSKEFQLQLNLPSGNYIVQIASPTQIVSRKVFLN
jgi:predicted outer membrane repeat protein